MCRLSSVTCHMSPVLAPPLFTVGGLTETAPLHHPKQTKLKKKKSNFFVSLLFLKPYITLYIFYHRST